MAGDGFTAVSPQATVLCIVDSADPRHAFFRDVLLPVFRFWGLPLRLFDLARPDPLPDAASVALVLLVQDDLATRHPARLAETVERATAASAGVVNCDPSVEIAPGPEGRVTLVGRTWAGVQGIRAAQVGQAHFVTALQRSYGRFLFAKPVPAVPRRADGATVALDSAAGPLLTLRAGEVRVVEWGLASTVWSADAFGFGRGMDALFWRSLLWAARKPFAMAAFPPWGRFRFDDCRGVWRTPDDLRFLDVMAEFAEVPNLCVCLSSLTEDGWSFLAERARRGTVDVSPHVQAPEIGIFNAADDPTSGGDDPLATAIRTQFEKHRCRMSAAVSDHNHEITQRGIRIARSLGLTARMNVLRVDETWDGVHKHWRPAPFGRLHYALDRFIDAPDLFVAINHHLSFSDSFTSIDDERFLCTTFGGYTEDRWDFLNGLVSEKGRDIDRAIERLLAHAELGLNSLFFMGAISHTHFIRHLGNQDWLRVLSAYRSFVDPHGYRPLSYDRIAGYAGWRRTLGEVEISPTEASDGAGVLWGLVAEERAGTIALRWQAIARSSQPGASETKKTSFQEEARGVA
jgi:hypothetical protein